MKLSDKIRGYRELANLSVNQLGRLTGAVNGSHISNIEKGRRPNIALGTACRLASVFGVTLDELIRGTEFDLSADDLVGCGGGVEKRMSAINHIVLTEAIKEKRQHFSYVEGSNAPRPTVNLSQEQAVTVDIKICYDYSPELIKEALTKIFETAMKCW